MGYHRSMNRPHQPIASFALVCTASLLWGCAPSERPSEPTPETRSSPPPAIQAWMDRLTVEHEYDPQTGFIVAREVVVLPAVLTGGPSLDDAVGASTASGRPLVVFATADRCAPCQQYKRDAMNDARVAERLESPGVLATHVEVDRNPDAAKKHLGGLAIPMTYLLRDGAVVATLRGQRSPEDLLAWMDEHGL